MSESKATHRKALGGIGLVALALGFIVAVSVSNAVFRGLRIDLTENDLYTLSPGTQRIMEGIGEPINLYLFFSDRATADVPYLRSYAARVREMLEEFAAHADGRLNVTVVDPLPFSEDEDRAAAFGLQSINLGTGPDPIYLGVAGTNSVGDDEAVAFLDPGKEAFLEYELARLVHSLANPERAVVGLLSSLPMLSGFDPATQQVRPPWLIAEQLRAQFELKTLEPDLESVDPDVGVLMVVHPKDLPDTALYAIDQFVLRGGRALFFVDPHAEVDPAGGEAAMLGMTAGRSSSLETLLAAWGVEVTPEQVVLDDRYGLQVLGADGRPVRHLGILGVDAQGLDADDVITADLNSINFAFAGHIRRLEGGAAELSALVRSSDVAGLLPADRLAMLPDPSLLRDDFQAAGERFVLAARLTGEVPSAFPKGPPAPPTTAAADDGAVPGGEAAAGHLERSSGPINVVLVADADMLADRLWVQQQDFFGQQLNTAFANNGDLVVNAIDNLLGSEALISIRGRAAFSRPFTRVQELRRTAEARFRQTQQRLENELRETEARLGELSAGSDEQGAAILTPEQMREIDRFTQRRLELRRELRQVQRGLDRDIERLGTTLKAINIGLVPVLISVLSIGLWLWRRRART